MARLNREDSRTVLPQMEKWIDEFPQIVTGQIPQTTVAASSYVDVEVAFDSLLNDPLIIVGLVSNSTAGGFGNLAAAVLRDSVSSKGFTCRIHNADSFSRVPAVNWVAIST